MLPNPDYGTRVYYKSPKGLCVLGIVTRKEGDKVTILTDKNTKIVDTWTPASDSFQQVVYWKEVPKSFKNPVPLEKYFDYTPVKALFKENTKVVATPVLLKAMYIYANEHGFDGKLTMPELKVTDNRRLRGTYFNGQHPGDGQINISNLNSSYALLFKTVVHEMCHQYNYEIEYMDGLITKQDISIAQGHGPVFEKVAEKIGKKLGVKIERFYDNTLKNVEVNAKNAKKTSPYCFILMLKNAQHVYGFSAPNLVKAYELVDELSYFLNTKEGKKFVSTKLFGGVSRFADPKKYLSKKLGGNKPIPPEMVSLLEKDYEPVDFLDSMEDFKETYESL